MNLVLELILKMIYLQHNLTFKDNLLIKLTEFLMSADFVVFLKETLTKELQVQHRHHWARHRNEASWGEGKLGSKGFENSFYTYLNILVCVWAGLDLKGKSNEISPFLLVTASQQLCDSKFPGLFHPTVCCLSRCKSWWKQSQPAQIK